MVLAYHCIFGMYGFWLPNDPRGSGSDYVASWELFRYGQATKTNSRRSVVRINHDRNERSRAKQLLRFVPVLISGAQAVTVVQGFQVACNDAGYLVHACAILPDHVHLVIGRHPRNVRRIVGHFKSRATSQLKKSGQWRDDGCPVWGAHGWNVYLNDLQSVERAIRYVEDNPPKEGKRIQRWSIVTPFDLSASRATRRNEAKVRKLGGAALQSMESNRHRDIRAFSQLL